MSARPIIVACLALAAAASLAGQALPLRSGIDLATIDRAVRPQDDLFRFANGVWLARTEIPPDRVAYGAFQEIGIKVEHDLHNIIKDVVRNPDRWGVQGRQIADLYDSMIDQGRVEAAGIEPALRQLRRIASISSPAQLAREAGYLSATGFGGPFDGQVGDDPQRPGSLIVRVVQGGTLLPDADHYLANDQRYVDIRAAYEAYLTKLFVLAGRESAAADARSLVAFEIALASAQWTARDSRDATKADGRFELAQLSKTMPGFDWLAWATPQGIHRASVIVLAQPSFFQRFATIVATTPLDTLKLWLMARYLTSVAPFIHESFGAARFELFGRSLTGQEAVTERWRRGVSLVNGYLGDALGRLYIHKHFAKSSKRKVEALVDTIVRAYCQAIAASEWLSPRAKAEAIRKLERLRTKIAYPDVWRSYRGFDVRRGDLLGNVERGRRHEGVFRGAFGRGETDARYWLITPQTVNASYSPAANEMVVPAAMLQPPFFDADAEDAVNYGAIGAIVGHEIGHALDDRGRFFDANGRVRNWWSSTDSAQYVQRAALIVDQFNRYEPVTGARIDGIRTLHENISDLSGLSIAYAAYQLSLGGRTAPVIDDLTGDQRFFIAWARAWRSQERDDYLRQWVITMPHSPPAFRVNGIVAHIPAFFAAFDVNPGDRLYRAPAQRVKIW